MSGVRERALAEIASLVRQRDAVLAAHVSADGGDARADRALEVTSELVFPLA